MKCSHLTFGEIFLLWDFLKINSYFFYHPLKEEDIKLMYRIWQERLHTRKTYVVVNEFMGNNKGQHRILISENSYTVHLQKEKSFIWKQKDIDGCEKMRGREMVMGTPVEDKKFKSSTKQQLPTLKFLHYLYPMFSFMLSKYFLCQEVQGIILNSADAFLLAV